MSGYGDWQGFFQYPCAVGRSLDFICEGKFAKSSWKVDPVYSLQGNIKKVQMLEFEIVCFLMTQTC